MISDNIESLIHSLLASRIKVGLNRFGKKDFHIEVKQIGTRTYRVEFRLSRDSMFFLKSEKTTLRDISKIVKELENKHKIAIEKDFKHTH